MDYVIDRINLKSERAVKEVRDFLKEGFDIDYTGSLDTTIVIRDNDENIIATSSRDKDVFKYIGICSKYQGENLSGKLLNELISDAFLNGIHHYFIFTKPENKEIFTGSGFSEILTTDMVCLLEMGSYNIESALNSMKESYISGKIADGTETSAIVMNLNPFTLGHRYLIEYAARRSNQLIIFLVEEDSSVFSYDDRLEMLREGVCDLNNVTIIPSGPYLISRATFPTYFLKNMDNMLKAYTQLDAKIFSKYYGRIFNIKKRYLGEEPIDIVTREYNENLKNILEKYGIEVEIIERKTANDNVISASRVRKLLTDGDEEKAYELIPKSTKKFLESEKGKKTIEKLKSMKN